ncbi:DNA replication complex GINS protein SLD5 [Leucoraja erinacea]|uniref:DNA replication complex GINS protein SLD5 n=1 Tax=Leucoraja erinaceus TaxID=7782 RepID=UPI0024566957|nr:DNA replication complex GINS protein SLD5 [Leucoraja erinacea]
MAATEEELEPELELEADSLTEEDDEEILTPAQLIHKLEEAWLNEKFSPDLLECKSEIVECVMEQLDHMEKNLQRAKKGDLKITVHRMEMERIRYVLSSYLRSRLRKIEKFFPHILEKERSRPETVSSFLSAQEVAFAKEPADQRSRLACTREKGWQCSRTLDVAKPNLDSFVFLRVKEKQENVLVEPETGDQREYTVDLEEGSQHLMRYRTIAPLVASGAVQLI